MRLCEKRKTNKYTHMVSDGTKAFTWLQLRVAVLLFHVLEFLLKNNLANN